MAVPYSSAPEAERHRLAMQAEVFSGREHDAVITHGALSSGSRLLSVGCGWGHFERGLIGRVPALLVDGVDIEPEPLAAARRHVLDRGFVGLC